MHSITPKKSQKIVDDNADVPNQHCSVVDVQEQAALGGFHLSKFGNVHAHQQEQHSPAPGALEDTGLDQIG